MQWTPFTEEFQIYTSTASSGNDMNEGDLLNRFEIGSGLHDTRAWFRYVLVLTLRPDPNNPPVAREIAVDNTGADALPRFVWEEGGTHKWQMCHFPGLDETIRLRYEPNREDVTRVTPSGDVEGVKPSAGLIVPTPDGSAKHKSVSIIAGM